MTSELRELIYQGSVKNVWRVTQGLIFSYTDQYSLFDWGVMPDLIPQKGVSLAMMHRNLYSWLAQQGITVGLVTDPLFWPQSLLSHEVLVEEFDKFHCAFDEQAGKWVYRSAQSKNYLLPLEVVFRFRVHGQSSFVERWNHQTKTNIKHGDMLPNVVIEFFSKLEDQDRFLCEEEVKAILGCGGDFIDHIRFTAIRIAELLRSAWEPLGFELWDGKFEFGFKADQRQLVLVDAIGLDEVRLTFDQIPFSKEVLRDLYRRTSWYHEVVEKKRQALDNPHLMGNWKNNVTQKPPRLPQPWIDWVSRMYQIMGLLEYDMLPMQQSKIRPQLDQLKRDYQNLIGLEWKEFSSGKN
ncbi:MAG: hypothetical protein NZ480_00955 [Bdellovibrionaceae bacterium]|nr:hypothetical protein [Pseudobdellovibrionaceae bacterium]